MVWYLLQDMVVPAQGPISGYTTPTSLDKVYLLSEVGIYHTTSHGIHIPVHHLRGQGPCSLSRAHPVYELRFFSAFAHSHGIHFN